MQEDPEKTMLAQSIIYMTSAVQETLGERFLSGYLYGSAVLNDFQLGWSDIDVLYLSRCPLGLQEAEALVNLRQAILEKEPGNPYYRSFEGAILSLEEFLQKKDQPIVYWGTSGQRIKSQYDLDPFSRLEILQYGRLLAGEDVRSRIPLPAYSELAAAVQFHYDTIRKYAVQTNESLYSCGWLLDIARCIFTLRTGTVIAKTQAGAWALENHLCPDEASLRRTIKIRRNPLQYKIDPETKRWLASLGPTVQAFADVLEKELKTC